MSNSSNGPSSGAGQSLPERPNLQHLKNQAKDLLRAGDAASLADAQFQIARMYGFASWPKLKAYVESLGEIGELKSAIVTLTQTDFVVPDHAADDLMTLADQYVAAFRKVEGGARPDAKTMLKDLSANVSRRVVPAKHAAVNTLIEKQLAKLS